MTDRPNDEAALLLDLAESTFFDPYALVTMACLAESAVTYGGPVVVRPPNGQDQANYLARMGLDEALEQHCGCTDARLPTVNKTWKRDRLHELTRYVTEDGADELLELVSNRVEPLLGAGRAQPFLESLEEISQNAPQHSGVGAGYYAAQVYEPGTANARVLFAVGDWGQGIRQSLAGTQFARDTDEAAITIATEKHVSRYDTDRGFGLHFVTEKARHLRATIVIRSGDARVEFGRRFFSVRTAFEYPGTVVFGEVPCA